MIMSRETNAALFAFEFEFEEFFNSAVCIMKVSKLEHSISPIVRFGV